MAKEHFPANRRVLPKPKESDPPLITASHRTQFEVRQPLYRKEDLVLTPFTEQALETALSKIRYHDILYNDWNLQSIDRFGKRITINLYGPPGTGKSLCAEVIAQMLDKTIIQVNYAEIESKYVGDTPKNIVGAFTEASKTNSVLFFDEADSILGKRLTRVTQSADHGVNVSRSTMLMQLDRFEGVVIFATNLARNYDPAFVRRILAHIPFDLPDRSTRIRLWQKILPKEVPRAEDVTIEWLSDISDGLVGGDILQIVLAMCSRAVQRHPSERQVTRQDAETVIETLRYAKKNVGSSFEHKLEKPGKRIEVEVQREELPPEALENLAKIEAIESETNHAGQQVTGTNRGPQGMDCGRCQEK